jgi:CheY-like chemotaxis protein
MNTRPEYSRPFPGQPNPDGGSAGRRDLDREGALVVLVVEDEPDTLEAVAELLEDEDVNVLRARHGREALDLLEEGARPSLILLDLRMPVMDGWEFCRRIAADPRLAQIPVAIVTASASVDAPARARDAGIFVKPVNYARLLALVERLRS